MISIVIPAYNEQHRLPGTLHKIQQYLEHKQMDAELIVVDDGSTDDTLREIPDHIKVVENGNNQGKGYSVQQGVLAAQGDYIFFSDADLSTPIEEIEKLLPALQNECEVAIASRAVKGADIQIRQPLFREWMGKIFNVFVRFLVIPGIADTQCGFKGFRREAIQRIFTCQKIRGFGFDVEILYLAKKFGYKIKEIPVVWINSEKTKVSVWKDPLLMFMDLLRVRLLHLFEKES